MIPSRKLYRILDANFNRCREGLRVCEDVARFVLDAKTLSSDLKRCRHAVTDVWKEIFEADHRILASRDVRGDVGKKPTKVEEVRKGFWGLYWANSQRAKEALRALEETAKLVNVQHARTFKRIRFKVYAIEKRALPKLEAVRHHDAGRGTR